MSSHLPVKPFLAVSLCFFMGSASAVLFNARIARFLGNCIGRAVRHREPVAALSIVADANRRRGVTVRPR